MLSRITSLLFMILVIGAMVVGWLSQQRHTPDEALQAAMSGNAAKLRGMLRNQPGLANVRDSDGMTPLHWAARYGRVPAVEVLLASGADPNIQSKHGLTPLHMASYTMGNQESLALARLLISHGANPNKQTTRGYTPLHLAVFLNHRDVAQILLDHGASPDIPNMAGRSPLGIAERAGYIALAKQLRVYSKNKGPIKIYKPDESSRPRFPRGFRRHHPGDFPWWQ